MCLHLWKRENSRKKKKKQINLRKRRKKTSHRDWVYECALRNSRASSLSSIFPASIILLGAQSILGWWSVIVAPLFRIWGFPGFSPEKMAHCVAFECSNQAKTKQDPKLRSFCFHKDNSLRRAWIHAVGKTSPPKIPVCVRIIAEAIATINHA